MRQSKPWTGANIRSYGELELFSGRHLKFLVGRARMWGRRSRGPQARTGVNRVSGAAGLINFNVNYCFCLFGQLISGKHPTYGKQELQLNFLIMNNRSKI